MDISKVQAQNPAPGASGSGKSQQGPGTQPTFADTWNRIQAQYGKKPEQQRQMKKQLDKDDFMRIMITQMQHQDPTKPFEADKIAQEIAQITSVEQLSAVSKALDKLSTQNRPLERLAMTNLIGKEVTVDRNRFTHFKGENTPVNFALPEKAAQVNVALVSEKGEVILEKDLGPHDAGDVTFNWDGKKGNTLDSDSGIYMVRVTAKGEHDETIQTQMSQKARVIGVSFQGDTPVFLVGSASNPSRVPMDSVVQIEHSMGMPDPTAVGEAVAQAGSANPNIFTFQKGVGSQPVETAKANEISAAMARYQAQAGSAPAPAEPSEAPAIAARQAPSPPPTPGFPNGLGFYNESNQEGGEGE